MEYKLEHKLEHLNIREIKKHIPQHCFTKQPVTGILYMVRDIGIWCLALLFLLRGYQSFFGIFIYWMVAGMCMWCLFLSGHDCGHGSFSDSFFINQIVGHITHGVVLVPFNTWA